MDIAYTNMQYASLKKTNSKKMLMVALQSSDPRVKSAGCLLAHEYNFEFVEDLIDAIDSSDVVLSQSARQSLIVLSNKAICGNQAKKQENSTATKSTTAKPTVVAKPVAKTQQNHYVDFGPHINYMDNVSINASQMMWKTWFSENVKDCKKE